jgi:hypothetical protein
VYNLRRRSGGSVDNLLVNPRGGIVRNFRLFSLAIARYCAFGQYWLMASWSVEA